MIHLHQNKSFTSPSIYSYNAVRGKNQNQTLRTQGTTANNTKEYKSVVKLSLVTLEIEICLSRDQSWLARYTSQP